MLNRIINYIFRTINLLFTNSMSAPADIFAELKEVEYQANLSNPLEVFDKDGLLQGRLSAKSSFILRLDNEEYALSQWVSPKRTRTFPFARVYDTLCRKNRVALIPFCKDEGADGDRDFIQWDTVSLMSLLNVYVIVCYYADAERNMRPGQENKNKITKQVLEYGYVYEKLIELQQYHSSALHWNLKQMEELPKVVQLTLDSYQKISDKLKVRMHRKQGIEKRLQIITTDTSQFKELSRELAIKAQRREVLTVQPKEKVTGEKATVTIKNMLGGVYYFTADEHFVLDDRVFLVEKKHSERKFLPSPGDIKDAFIKLALFSNIKELRFNGRKMPCFSVVGLTSKTMRGVFHSKMANQEIVKFFHDNEVNQAGQDLIKKMVMEAEQNNFGIFAINERDVATMQKDILKMLL